MSALFEDKLTFLVLLNMNIQFEVFNPKFHVVTRTVAIKAPEIFRILYKVGGMLTMPVVALKLFQVIGTVLKYFTVVLTGVLRTGKDFWSTRLHSILRYIAVHKRSSKMVLSCIFGLSSPCTGENQGNYRYCVVYSRSGFGIVWGRRRRYVIRRCRGKKREANNYVQKVRAIIGGAGLRFDKRMLVHCRKNEQRNGLKVSINGKQKNIIIWKFELPGSEKNRSFRHTYSKKGNRTIGIWNLYSREQ